MNLTHRRVTCEDLAAHAETLFPCYGPHPDIILQLPAVWREMLAAGAMVSSLVEDGDRPAGNRIVAMGASVFVQDDFMAEAGATMPPYLGTQIVRRIFQGRTPILDRAAIRRENGRAGLNLCILHFGFPGLPPEQLPDPRVHEKHFQAFFHYHPGHHIKDFLREVQGESWRRWMLAAGTKLRRDYGEYYALHPAERPPADRHPYLTGLSRAESLEAEGARVFPIFLNSPARLGFTASQRELLLCALGGETDEELARSLFVSLSAIKKRWFSIYDRVERVDQHLLPVVDEDTGKRGSERRRYLLNYLREHPEEIHSPTN